MEIIGVRPCAGDEGDDREKPEGGNDGVARGEEAQGVGRRAVKCAFPKKVGGGLGPEGHVDYADPGGRRHGIPGFCDETYGEGDDGGEEEAGGGSGVLTSPVFPAGEHGRMKSPSDAGHESQHIRQRGKLGVAAG